jgi:hypothetical protein
MMQAMQALLGNEEPAFDTCFLVLESSVATNGDVGVGGGILTDEWVKH